MVLWGRACRGTGDERSVCLFIHLFERVIYIYKYIYLRHLARARLAGPGADDRVVLRIRHVGDDLVALHLFVCLGRRDGEVKRVSAPLDDVKPRRRNRRLTGPASIVSVAWHLVYACAHE